MGKINKMSSNFALQACRTFDIINQLILRKINIY
jgi:hypothetical protein